MILNISLLPHDYNFSLELYFYSRLFDNKVDVMGNMYYIIFLAL